MMNDDVETITGAIADVFTHQDAEGIARCFTDNAQVCLWMRHWSRAERC
jgi:hypothetical protein